MKYKLIYLLEVIFCCLFASGTIGQDLKLANIFADHMVLQRGEPVPIWGSATPNENIVVTFGDQIRETTCDTDGEWKVTLDPLCASKESRTLKVLGNDTIYIEDVLVGEVWICSGQSNMQFGVGGDPDSKKLIPFANNIRTFEVKRTVALKEAEEVEGSWQNTIPTSAVAFSFAFFFESIAEVPVGIIHASWGSSSIEAWMPRQLTQKLPHFKTIMEDFDADKITQDSISAILSKPNGWSRQEDIYLRRQPNILYNGMIKPLVPFANRGLIWYQGERNTRYLSGMPKFNKENWFHQVGGMNEYGQSLKEWIKSYREIWNDDEMKFMIVMLPGYGGGTMAEPDIDPEDPDAESWAWMRESQMEALELPHTVVANTIDLGDVKDIHPKDKMPIGQRLALLANKQLFNGDELAMGPILDRTEVKGGRIEVYFKNADGLRTIDSQPPSAFWIAGEEGNWKKANAKIENEKVILDSEEISSPKYVRYAFAGKPYVNLVNERDLPAYPFRTDTFEK